MSLVLALFSSDVKGELFNAASIYLTWEDVARLITDLVNPEARVIAIDASEWKGSAFLTDDWPLSIEKAEKMLNFKTNLSREKAIANLSDALKISADKVRAQR